MLESKNSPNTPLSNLGEFALIEHLTKNFNLTNKSSLLGIGDDAAIINDKGKLTLITTDLLIEGIHFDLGYVPLKHLGYKSVMVNLSDLYAMNVYPSQITTSIAVSNRFSLEALEEIYEGFQLACKNYNVDLIGGDTTSSNTGLIISITATGFSDKDRIVNMLEESDDEDSDDDDENEDPEQMAKMMQMLMGGMKPPEKSPIEEVTDSS